MTAAVAKSHDPAPIQACAVSRDLWDFSLLAEDMEAVLGDAWCDLTFEEAGRFLRQARPRSVDYVVLALDSADETDAVLAQAASVVSAAKAQGVRVLLVAENLRPASLHGLLRAGADDFVPYPLPEGALREALARLDPAPAETAAPAAAIPGFVLPGTGLQMAALSHPVMSQRNAAVIAVHGMAGGVGATTFAVNLAWELANPEQKHKQVQTPPRVCLIDLDLQFGAIATYLDLPRRELIFELLSDTARMDAESFGQALMTYRDRLHVLTGPADMLPLDFLATEDVLRLLDQARAQFDYVIIDMPQAVVAWTEAILNQVQGYYALVEMEMRSAQNTLRMIRALQAENLPVEKLHFVLNRAPKFTDFAGRGRVKRLADNLGIALEVQLCNGGAGVTSANDQAEVLAKAAPRAPLRREIQKLAQTIAAQSRVAVG